MTTFKPLKAALIGGFVTLLAVGTMPVFAGTLDDAQAPRGDTHARLDDVQAPRGE